MQNPYILPLADPQAVLETVGGKGASLARLSAAGLPVPPGFHITTAAYRQFVAANDLQPAIAAALQDADVTQPATLETVAARIHALFVQAAIPADIAAAIQSAYATLAAGFENATRTTPPVPVAVRSSATAEDLPDLSFAGQQETYLNLQGAAAVLEAVKRCWASLWTARAIGYRLQHGVDQAVVSLAVVVQALVPAAAAGILFTANPLNGRRDEVLINAAWGLGEAIVGGLVTPDTYTVDKSTGQVSAREIADKQVLTVRTAQGTEERPVPEAQRQARVLTDAQVAELAALGRRIEALYGTPQDVEWCWAEGDFFIVQARPITALPEAPTPIEWPLPNPKGQYMHAGLADLMPDPVSPLFETLAIPTIARVGVKEVLRPLTRSEPQLPDYIVTINSYVYINGTYTLREWWWILTQMILSAPRMLREALPLWRDQIRPRYAATVARWQAGVPEALSLTELWAGIQELNNAAMLHFSSLLVATTGASAGAEMLFTNVYTRLIRRAGDPAAPVFLMGYDTTPIQAEKSLYDLAEWVRVYPDLAEYILHTPSADLATRFATSPSLLPAPHSLLPDFYARLQTHLNAYGHIVYDLDFATPLPLDDPTPMLETIKMYLRGAGANPHERQQAAAEKREQAVAAIRGRLKGLRRWAFEQALKLGQAMAQVRENALADIGLGYPVLRALLRELGRRLVQGGSITAAEDIFWLQVDEVQQALTALERGESLVNLAASVAQRQARHAALKRVSPPPMLPPRKRYLGINVEAFAPVSAESQTGGTLKGIGASAGRVTAPACILHGPEDFDQMKPGCVLVAGTTTPAWTPLFAMAAAVVTDVGGPLSHGSIVAREYGIPAVMGTGVATRRIRSGQTVTVDGSAGTVTLS